MSRQISQAVINRGWLKMNSVFLILLGLALAATVVVVYLMLKKKKTGETIKEAQLDALGLGDKHVTP